MHHWLIVCQIWDPSEHVSGVMVCHVMAGQVPTPRIFLGVEKGTPMGGIVPVWSRALTSKFRAQFFENSITLCYYADTD